MIFFRLKTYFLVTIVFLLVINRGWGQEAEQHYLSSLEYSEKGAYQQSLHIINKAIAIDSTQTKYFLHRAKVQYFLGSYDNTIKDCYTTLNLKPNLPEVYFLRGKVCVVTESYGPAILFFGKTLKYANTDDLRFDAFLNRGNAYFAIRRYTDALSDFNEAYAIDNSSLEVLLPLSETYLYLKKPDQAIQILNKAIEQNPEYARSYELLGKIAYQKNDFPMAISAFEKYSVLNPKEVNAHNFLADLYLQIQDYEKAMSSLNNSLTIDPLEPNAYKIKGLIYLDQGEEEKGCNTLFRAIQLGYFEKYGYDLLDIYIEKCEDIE